MARRNMPANPPSDQWAEHRHDRVAPIRGSLCFLIFVRSFKVSFANHLAVGCNVFPFFADGVAAETEFVGTPD
jgi:hypothetical protein